MEETVSKKDGLYNDWQTKMSTQLSHQQPGMVYLNQLNTTRATEIMKSPQYTRAIIVRDPKKRILSAYLNKVLQQNSTNVVGACCKMKKDCWAEEVHTFTGFYDLTKKCLNTHWRPQSEQMEPKFLPIFDFLGHIESMEQVTSRLLEKIGAWEGFGASG
jgi:hypothetical protein